MPRSHHLVSSLLVLAACSSAPTPAPEPGPFAPAPNAEVAMPMAVAQEGTELVYGHTDAIELSWRDTQARRQMDVAFELSYGMAPGSEDAVGAMVRQNWEEACKAALVLCASHDIATESGLRQCEEALRLGLTETLFGCGDEATTATVQRVIWKRVLWD